MFRRGRAVAAATAVAGAVAMVSASCAPDLSTARPLFDAFDRSVHVITSPCGAASGRVASGVLVSGDRIVTAAHVVVDAESVSVAPSSMSRLPGGSPFEFRVETRSAPRLDTVDADGEIVDVVALDLDADLAVLHLRRAVPQLEPLQFATFVAGQRVAMIGGAASGTSALRVERSARFEIEAVRSNDRITRGGYELRGRSADGDSGSGVYDEYGRLGGIVFAASEERDAVLFAVAADELDRVLDEAPQRFVCDPDRSRLVASGS